MMNATETQLNAYFSAAPLSDAADAEAVQVLALGADFWQDLYQTPFSADPVDDRPELDVDSADFWTWVRTDAEDADF